MAERDGRIAADVPPRPPTQNGGAVESGATESSGADEGVPTRPRQMPGGQRQAGEDDPAHPGGTEAIAADAETADPSPADPPAADDQCGFVRLARLATDIPVDAPVEGRVAVDTDGVQTSELREALDELRRVLEVGGAPAPVRRRRRGHWLLAGLLVLAVAAAAAGARQQLVTHSRLTPASSQRAAGQIPPPAVHLSSATPSVSTLPPVGTTPAGGTASTLAPVNLPETGPGISSPGTYLTAAVDSDPDADAIDVYEQVVFPAPGLDALTLSMVSPSALEADLAAARPRVSNLQVVVDGQVARAVPSGPSTWAVTALQGGRFTKAQLRYRVAGAIVRSTPSLAGRALALISPLTGAWALPAREPIALRLSSAGVRGITCPSANPTEMLCGNAAGPTWTATLPASATSPVFVVQIDLAPPS